MRRLIFPVLMGVLGVAVLVSLGVWQVQRLTWKEGILAEIEARIVAAPVELPAQPDEGRDEYLPVTVTGDLLAEEVHVLTAADNLGAGYRDIAVMQASDGTRLLVDRGFIALEDKDLDRSEANVTVVGNLLWPDEVDNWTPEPDLSRNIWFARDLPAMAASLGTEPVLVVARTQTGSTADITPLPIDTAGIPNDHLNYAITWFSLALVWAVMSGFLIVRTLRRKD
ncbi:MAG: SURF1 family protein [Flavimaricola sp.]|nr:SURF1 family protein [Flavimaricola sp.]